MALFGSKKTETKDEAPVQKTTSSERKQKTAKAVPNTPEVSVYSREISHILKHARITEKATNLSAGNVYVFDVAVNATKTDIVAAVRALYKVVPEKIAIVTVPSKARRSMRNGKLGIKRGGKKAYIFLKKGETITIS
jgi:large subunit ribosomal protein L23